MHDEFGDAHRRTGSRLQISHRDIQVGTQLDAIDERAKNEFTLVADQECLVDEGEPRSDRKDFSIVELWDVFQGRRAPARQMHELNESGTPAIVHRMIGVGVAGLPQADPRAFFGVEIGGKKRFEAVCGVKLL